jgi:TrpR family transcriptional regulator, trp operon repressor
LTALRPFGYVFVMSNGKITKDQAHELEKVFAEIMDCGDMISLFEEIFTQKELRDLNLRWQLLKELYEGQTQRSIASRYRISLCKITRGSRVLKKKGSTVKKILDAHYGKGYKPIREK